MILVVDNYDSFTYNLVDYFNQLNIEVETLRNDTSLHDLLSEKYSGIVLSPGPGLPTKAENLMHVLEYYHKKIPVLGICLGHQAIGEFFKGEIIKAQTPMHGKLSQISQSGDAIFNNLPSTFNVVRYHSLICSNLPEELQILALSDIGEIMALKHKSLPIYGLQFHPEAVLTQFGLEILKNWVTINSLAT